MILCSASLAGASDARIAQLSRKYSHASSEKEKMAICIEAIDSGIICQGASITDVDLLFGTNFSKWLPDKGGEDEIRTVNFVDPIGGSETVQAAMRGWYLVVVYGENGIIRKYYLTNIHK